MKRVTQDFRAIAVAVIGVISGVAHAQPRYDFVLVDSFNANPLAGESYLWDISDNGIACGVATMDNVIGYPGFIWNETTGKTRINVSSPLGVNAAGLVVGNQSAFDIYSGQYFSPPALPGTYYGPSFGGVNDSGVAVGTISGCSCSDSGGVTNVPYVWDVVNGARSVNVPNARGLSRVNNSGIAIGWLNGWVLNDAFYVDISTGSYTLLNDVFPSGFGSGPTRAFEINNHGAIVGTRYGTFPVTYYGYVYSPSAGVQILPFPGAGYQQAVRPLGINDAGTVVGDIFTVQASAKAFIYTTSDGIHDLNSASLVASIPVGYTMTSAQKINNSGWIVGNGRTAAGKLTGFVLKPRAPICAADFNGDGTLDFFDYLDFVDAFSHNMPSADFNSDSTIDFFDYLDFVDSYQAGC